MAKNSGERILVADDDATSRKLLTRILTRAGFDCAEAPDGIEALKLLRADPPSLLLLDYDMPGMDGAEVLKQLRQDGNAAVNEALNRFMLDIANEALPVFDRSRIIDRAAAIVAPLCYLCFQALEANRPVAAGAKLACG